MTKAEAKKSVLPGLYVIHWKKGDGASIAAVGMLHDGTRWFAPSNWTSKAPSGIASTNWRMVASVKRL